MTWNLVVVIFSLGCPYCKLAKKIFFQEDQKKITGKLNITFYMILYVIVKAQ